MTRDAAEALCQQLGQAMIETGLLREATPQVLVAYYEAAMPLVRTAWQEMVDEVEFCDKLLELQRQREQPWIERWRQETGKQDTIPDYGEFLGWLVAKLDALRADLRACAKALELAVGWACYFDESDSYYGEQQSPTFREDLVKLRAALARPGVKAAVDLARNID